MQTALENWKFISLLFLGVFGGLQISATFLWLEGWESPILEILSQGLDLPFLLAALAFGVVHVTQTAEMMAQKGALVLKVASGLSLSILVLSMTLNLLLPDAKFF